ncbi:MAG: DUF1460 domain-containing protein [Paludibacter sp.]|nr:DUF1460 domain-containing protein [Paludibacter sp.]
MKHVLVLVLTLLIFSLSLGAQLLTQDKPDELVLTSRDKEIVDTLLWKLKKDQKLETGSLIIKVGKLLLETPYVANTLEKGGNEKMVINLRELDCTTFAENCLALARTIQNDNPTFYKFVDELKYIRYRDGLLNEYPSRLHYFSDWIFNNDKKKTVKSISSEFGNIPLNVRVSFMSKHPELYPALKNNPEFVRTISKQEDEISNRKSWYNPKNRFTEFEHLLHDGDILGITTSMPGMDISHVVIAIHKEGRIHIIHASLKHKKVIISTETLEQYLKNYKAITGIMVARPL